MLTLTVGLVTVIVLCVLWKFRFHNTPGKKPLPPGSMGWPFVGETGEFVFKGVQFFVERFAQYGNIYKTHLLGTPTVRVAGSVFLRDLISKEPRLLTMKWPPAARKMMGQHGVAVATGDEHRRTKNIVQQVFVPSRLSDYLPCIQGHIRHNLLAWCQRSWMLGFPACESLMTDIMTEVLLGVNKDSDKGGLVREAIVTINKNIFSLPFEIPGGGFKKAMDGRGKIVNFIQSRLAVSGQKDHVSMLDVIRTHHGSPDGLTDQQVMDNMVTLLVAGSGTTSGALCMCLLHLGRNPEVRQKLKAELEQYGLLDNDLDPSLTYDMIQQLEYVHCVEKEVLRLSPPAGGAFRTTMADLETQGYSIPKDWTVVYSIRDTHNEAEVFSQRDQFWPDRWRDKDLEKRLRGGESYNYLPFGSGPRFCVGRQLAKMIIHVFVIECVRLVEWTLHNPNPPISFIPVTMPKDYLPITCTEKMRESNPSID